jgi:hypothetical protein
MAGALVMVFILLIAIPVGVLMSGAAVAAVLGWFLRSDAEARHQGSELIDTNR